MLANILKSATGTAPLEIISSIVRHNSSSSTSVIVDRPSTYKAGDLILVLCTSANTAANMAPASGWTTHYAPSFGRLVASKTATASEPTTYTFTQDASANSNAFAVVLRSAAIDEVGVLSDSATTTTAPAVNVSDSDNIVFLWPNRNSSAGAWTVPSPYDANLLLSQLSTNPSGELFFAEDLSTGSTGTVSCIGTITHRSMLISIKKA